MEAEDYDTTEANEEDDQQGEEDEGSQEEEEEEEEDGNTVAQENASDILNATSTLASLSDPERLQQVREVGHEAVWSLSTAKPGNGVNQIRDSSPDTYWQSDGPQPHLINIHFAKRKAICEVAFYLDYSLDESYTPKRIGIKSGITFHDLEEVKVVEMNEPSGWVSVPLFAEIDPLDDDLEHEDDASDDGKEQENERERRRKPLRTHFIQICILSMHQNGRDTHVRQVKIFGPRAAGDAEIRAPSTFALGLPRFQTVELSQFSTIR